MQKVILYIIVIVVLTGAIVAAGWFFFLRDAGTTTPANTALTNTNTTNTAPVNASDLPLETEQGDTPVTATVTHNDVTFTFTSASRTKSWRDFEAPAGEEWVVVFFSPIEADVREATTWIRTDAKLVADGREVKPAQLKVVGTGGSSDDTGYFAFHVPTGVADFRIGFNDTLTPLNL